MKILRTSSLGVNFTGSYKLYIMYKNQWELFAQKVDFILKICNIKFNSAWFSFLNFLYEIFFLSDDVTFGSVKKVFLELSQTSQEEHLCQSLFFNKESL